MSAPLAFLLVGWANGNDNPANQQLNFAHLTPNSIWWLFEKRSSDFGGQIRHNFG
jgi:hypothetical protein